MGAAPPLQQLIAPIAAATVVTAFWFAAMWRGHQTEKQHDKPTWQYEIGLFGYIAALGGFVYFRAAGPSTGSLDLFGTALAAEGLGIIIVYALLHAFVLSRGQPWPERAFPVFAAVILSGGLGVQSRGVMVHHGR